MDAAGRDAGRLGRRISGDALVDAPPGWAYNPSSWRHRIYVVTLAALGFIIAGSLALYQLNVLTTVWEPFFGNGSHRILTGRISHLLPIPDAALGAFAYLCDMIAGLIGGTARWRKLPLIVVLFALLVVPFGLVSLTLFILQPTLYKTWCTPCLLSVAISVSMVPWAWDELMASRQWMRRRTDTGIGWWDALTGR